MSAPDYFGRLLLAVDGYNAKFPGGNTPFQIITRLCEEAGELATEVNLFEDTGVKRQKRGQPDKAALAKEVQDVMRTALSVARYYGIERELKDSIDQTLQRLRDGGYIADSSGQ